MDSGKANALEIAMLRWRKEQHQELVAHLAGFAEHAERSLAERVVAPAPPFIDARHALPPPDFKPWCRTPRRRLRVKPPARRADPVPDYLILDQFAHMDQAERERLMQRLGANRK